MAKQSKPGFYKGISYAKHNDRLVGRNLPVLSEDAVEIIIDAGCYQMVKEHFYISFNKIKQRV